MTDVPSVDSLTTADVARLTNKPARTLRWMAQTGAVPAKKNGRDWAFHPSVVDQLAREGSAA